MKFCTLRYAVASLAAVAGGASLALPHQASAKTYVVNLSLSRYSTVRHLVAGDYLGVSPAILRVRVGDSVAFANVDTHHHTATGIPAASNFSANPRWTDEALKPSAQLGPGAWSTGDLAPGEKSAPLRAVKPGAYLYGCFYDYSAGMRGQIIVEP